MYTKLAVIVSIAGFVAQGFMELLAQYLQLKLKYQKLDLVRAGLNWILLFWYNLLSCTILEIVTCQDNALLWPLSERSEIGD